MLLPLSRLPLLLLLMLLLLATCGGGTTFRWAYFPTHDAIRANILNAPPAATNWSLKLAAAGTPQSPALAELTGPLPVAASGQTWTIPTLKAGSYLVTLQLSSATAATVFTQTDSLNRTVRPWENNALGTEDILIPPFTALTVSGSVSAGGAGTRVGVVARELTL